MRSFPLLLCTLLILGCASELPTTTELGPTSSDSPAPIGDPFPGEAPEDLDHPLIRNGAAEISGTVTLNGSGTIPPVYDTAPFEAMISGRIDELMLITLTPTAIPGAANSPIVQFKGATTSYGSLPYPTNSTPQYMPIYLAKTESAGIVLHNSATVGGPLYTQAAKYVGAVKTIPKEDGGEPNDDGNVVTYTDRTMANTLPIGSTFNRSLYRKTAVTNEDREDWFKINVGGPKKYRISLSNSNGTWGSWAYDLRLLTTGGTVIASRLGVTDTSTTIDLTTTVSGTFYLQVAGNPLSRRGASVYYSTFSVSCKELAIPVISAVNPTGFLGAVDQSVTFSATASGEPTLWQWTFNGGVSDDATSAAAPTLELVHQGQYAGTVTATNAIGTSVPFNFTYNIAGPVIGWQSYDIAGENGIAVGRDCSVLVQGDSINIAHSRAIGQALLFSRATAINPAASDWSTHQVNIGNTEHPRLVYNSPTERFYIFYYHDAVKDLQFVRAIAGVPTSDAHWETGVFLNPEDEGKNPSAISVGTRLAVVYENVTTGRVRFARSTVDGPTGSADFAISDVSTTIPGVEPVLTTANGRFFIVAPRRPTNGLLFARTDTLTATATANWQTLTLETGSQIWDASITAHGTRPAFAYFRGSSSSLVVSRATSDTPGVSDFAAVIVDPMSLYQAQNGSSIADVDGRLAVSYYRYNGLAGSLAVARALVTDPLTPADWMRTTVDQETESAYASSLTSVDSKLILATGKVLNGKLALEIHLANEVF